MADSQQHEQKIELLVNFAVKFEKRRTGNVFKGGLGETFTKVSPRLNKQSDSSPPSAKPAWLHSSKVSQAKQQAWQAKPNRAAKQRNAKPAERVATPPPSAPGGKADKHGGVTRQACLAAVLEATLSPTPLLPRFP